MAGIYIHIPFCRQACHYCNFHFSTNLALQNDFTAALLKEIELRMDYLHKETVETVYFGGGTPSLLPGAWCVLNVDPSPLLAVGPLQAPPPGPVTWGGARYAHPDW